MGDNARRVSPNEHRPLRLTPNSPSNYTFPPRETPPSASPNRIAAHRQSFSEHLRGLPSSPRSRHPSLSQQAFQDLLNNPPLPHKGENPWEGKDWKHITVGEVIDPEEVHWSELSTSVETATKAGHL